MNTSKISKKLLHIPMASILKRSVSIYLGKALWNLNPR
jgi:hypothetical protein